MSQRPATPCVAVICSNVSECGGWTFLPNLSRFPETVPSLQVPRRLPVFVVQEGGLIARTEEQCNTYFGLAIKIFSPENTFDFLYILYVLCVSNIETQRRRERGEN